MENENNTSVPEASATNTPPNKKGHKALFGVLAYLGIFIVVSYLAAKDDPFVKFHIKQGLLLIIAGLILWILGPLNSEFRELRIFTSIIHFVIFVLAIIGIINAVQGREKELPFIGHLARHFIF